MLDEQGDQKKYVLTVCVCVHVYEYAYHVHRHIPKLASNSTVVLKKLFLVLEMKTCMHSTSLNLQGISF